MEKGFLDGYDPARARFRTYLRTCLDGFAANARKAERRLKRGGGVLLVPLDFETAEGDLARHDKPVDDDLDACFHREWIRTLFGLAVDALREQWQRAGKERQFEVFRRYDLEGPERGERLTYQSLADALGLRVTDVTNALSAAGREFRALLMARLRDLCPTEDEFRAEARHLFGGEPP